ncbi:MAG: phage major capsid protein [Hyphomonadaceae bacterium]
MPPLETRNAPLETREDDASDIAAMTRAVTELRQAVADGDKKRTDELKVLQDRLDEIELKSKRPTGGDPDSEDEATKLQKKAFGGFLRHGREALPAQEVRSLIVGDDTKGGYLAPSDFVAEVIKGIVQFSPVRQAARIMTTALGDVDLPRRTGRPTAQWVGETEDRTETGSTYGQVNIPVNEAACYVDVSLRLLEDSAVNVEAEVASDLAEEFGRLEGAAYVSGDGLKKPHGFTDSTSGLSYTPSGHASAFVSPTASASPADAFITLMYAMPPAYRANGVWMMNGGTIAAVRKFKDANGAFIWQPPIAAGQPPTLLGRPLIEAPDMSDVGANAFPIAFGDFNRGYRIVDKSALSIMRDPYTQATTGKVRFHARRRTGGAVVLAEAIRLMKIATT